MEKTTLEMVHEVYKKWLYIEDLGRVDVLLAVALSRTQKGVPLWLFLVGASGDMKSEQINALTNPDHTFQLNQLTSKTLVSGNPLVKDLAPELNGKLILTNDMAAMLELRSEEKAEIWAQLRDLYDGIAGKCSGTGKISRYTDIFVTWIAGSTPHIDHQILIHQTLGTRELIYRTKEKEEILKLMQRIMENSEKLEMMRAELKYITGTFLRNKEYKDREINEQVMEKLFKWSEYVCYMRAMAESDAFSGELLRDVTPEMPTRILQQLTRLYKSLMSLEDNYTDERALKIIEHVAKSSIFPIRVKVLDYLIKNPYEHTLSNVAKYLKIGKKTTYRELNILWNMNLIFRREEEVFFGMNKDIKTEKEIYYFSINSNHPFIQKMIEDKGDLLNVELPEKENEESKLEENKEELETERIKIRNSD